ncbi:questin oxidase family protein [Candidatus Bathyarchaeota archaeon]|nr:questin oxidase family protein [Candidatus Bathyarchaeota archaeon]
MGSKELGVEALAMTAVQYNYLHKYLEQPKYTKPSTCTTDSLPKLIHKLRGDQRFDGVFERPQFENFDKVFEQHEDLILEYWNAWEVSDPAKQFEECQEVAAALLVATVAPGTHSYNFFFAHILTTSHALRVLLPIIPAEHQLVLVRGWLLVTLGLYVAFLRPKIDPDYVDPSLLKGRHWSYVEKTALTSSWTTDAHYVKGKLIQGLFHASYVWKYAYNSQ